MSLFPKVDKVTTANGYTVEDYGVFPRVSNILGMANFGGNALKNGSTILINEL